jgi:hypothetical protein
MVPIRFAFFANRVGFLDASLDQLSIEAVGIPHDSANTRVPNTPAFGVLGWNTRPNRMGHPFISSIDTFQPRSSSYTLYGRASNTILNTVSVARRKRVNPPCNTTSRILFSPACAPNPAPTSWASDDGTQQRVEEE